MSSISSLSSAEPIAITQSGYKPGAPAPAIPSVQTGGQRDNLELSPAARAVLEAGRIAVDAKAGSITGTQATQLFSQLSTISKQIVTDQQANGGSLTKADAASIFKAQNQFGQQIYSDSSAGTDGTSPRTPFNSSDARQVFQTGRLVIDQETGKLSSAQASQLSAQIASTQKTMMADLQASGGTLTPSQAQAITQLQNQLSAQIYQAANPAGGANAQPFAAPTS